MSFIKRRLSLGPNCCILNVDGSASLESCGLTSACSSVSSLSRVFCSSSVMSSLSSNFLQSVAIQRTLSPWNKQPEVYSSLYFFKYLSLKVTWVMTRFRFFAAASLWTVSSVRCFLALVLLCSILARSSLFWLSAATTCSRTCDTLASTEVCLALSFTSFF